MGEGERREGPHIYPPTHPHTHTHAHTSPPTHTSPPPHPHPHIPHTVGNTNAAILPAASTKFCFTIICVRYDTANKYGKLLMGSLFNTNTSAAAAAASVGVLTTATPTVAAASAGASLIPSPTMMTPRGRVGVEEEGGCWRACTACWSGGRDGVDHT